MALLLLVLLLSTTASLVTAFSDGAPHHRCSNLVPMHDTEPQTSASPYTLVVSPNYYSPGDVIQVTLSSVGASTPFKGFALSAHRLTGDTEELVGGFDVPSMTQGGFWYSQNSSVPNCITHNGNQYTSVTFRWFAPTSSVGNVAFTTPVVQSFNTFWANITSEVVTANVTSADPAFSPLTIGQSPSPLSGSCGTDFGCVKSPALCDPASCDLYVKFLYVEADSKLKMEMQASGSYVALGLSDDSKMSDDLTLTCTASGDYSMQLGYNPSYRRLNERHRWTSLSDKYIQLLDGKRVRCEFSLPLLINITTYSSPRQGSTGPINRSFDLRNPHFMFLAHGSAYSGTNSVSKHTEMPAISNDKVNFLAKDSHDAHRISGLRRAHGSVMMLAWQVLVPLGANLAMFYRCAFTKTHKGVELWFNLHRGLVLSALILTVVGLLLIFAQFDWTWNNDYAITQSHGAMGLSLLCLMVIQILMGLFRPDLDSPKRWIFKVAHQVVAYSALGLADSTLITIGFLSNLPNSYHITHAVLSISWMIFHVAFRIGMSVMHVRWFKKIFQSVEKSDEHEQLENERIQKTRTLFIVFLTIMLIFFFAWFITLMSF